MGHQLILRAQNRSPSEIVAVLQQEFACVDADAAAGLAAAQAQASFIETRPAHLFPDYPAALAEAARLRALKEGDAFIVHLGDRSDLTVRLRLLPGHPIRSGIVSPTRKQRCDTWSNDEGAVPFAQDLVGDVYFLHAGFIKCLEYYPVEKVVSTNIAWRLDPRARARGRQERQDLAARAGTAAPERPKVKVSRGRRSTGGRKK